uniref:Large ribosomal subunit protein uL22c n=1 Tax=Bangiopsis subsimplex TaxID=139980 RepID=A0A1C9CCZ9_9RHOD|nr:ribosomal protein L22 [Bangiopsis subsimplex]AOM66271.1 ribosomal protein L22 [Bangiopsis subsimplex]ARO90367.1 50S ribosomal protein L22 [Bangiopsis subsimplex]
MNNQKSAIAVGRYIRTSPFKARRVLDQIRGKTYTEASLILEFMPYRSSRIILQILRSAIANAEHNYGLSKNQLKITATHADKGPIFKRFRPRAQGRGYPIRKPTCHITVEVGEYVKN